MLRPFRPEEIYDAATDDAAFEQLAATLAASIDARSAAFHWKDFREDSEEVSYSGYFSHEQMSVYERHFADADLWAAAVRQPDRVNRVWDCEQLVPSREYERARIYNEWVRPMGDDSFRAMGGALRTTTAIGEIGFHRGKGQPAFEPEAVRIVEDGLVHLRRMVAIRSKLDAAKRASASMSGSLDVIGHAVFTLDPSGRLIHCNLAGEEVLRRADGLIMLRRRLFAVHPADQTALQAAIGKAAAAREVEASSLLIQRGRGRPYELSLLSSVAGGRRQVVVVLTDPEGRDVTLPMRLRDLYGLTAAEGEVAVRLAEGASPATLADERAVTVGTIHSQLKVIFVKLGCRRQSELVAIVGNLPRLQSRR